MSEATLHEITRVVEETAEADDALRHVVALIVGEPGIDWAGVALLEDGVLTIGPSAGVPDETRRARVPIRYRGDLVGELVADGAVETTAFARVGELIAPLVLIAWDTGGEAWEP